MSTPAAVTLVMILSLWLAYSAYRALRTGRARAGRGVTYQRTRQRTWFWITVVGQVSLAVVGIIAAFWLLFRTAF